MAKHKYLLEIVGRDRYERKYFKTQKSVFDFLGFNLTKHGAYFDGLVIRYHKYRLAEDGTLYRMTRLFEKWSEEENDRN